MEIDEAQKKEMRVMAEKALQILRCYVLTLLP